MRHKSPAEWLKSVRAFEAMSDKVLKRLYAECHLQTIERGETLVKAGDVPEALYIVTSGRLRTSRFATEPARAELGPGAVLAETAFFAREPHVTSITAVRASIVLKLEWESFKALAESAPEVWQGAISSLIRPREGKLPARPRVSADRARSLAICPAGSDPVPPDFADRLAHAIEQRAECQILSSEGLGQDLPGGIALDDPQVVHWLKEQESRFDVIILVTDAEPTPWTERAIAEADEICLIGTHDGGRLGTPVPLGPVEELAFEMRGADACRLALFHDPRRGVAISGTRRWLEYRPVRSHHHLRPNAAKDFERLARFMLGQSTGYFATASGVFGAAALGIFKAVQASGFEPDCFGGTGAGAAVAACLALGMDPDDVDQLVTEIMVDRRALRRKNWPLFSLYDQRALDRLILKHFPDTDLADMPVPYYAASANLSTGDSHIHSLGNLQVAVRANWPFPGLLPPFVDEEGQMLTDGSVITPPPLQPMHRLNAGPNVVAKAALAPFGKSPVRYRDLPAWQKKQAAFRLPWQPKPDEPGLPSFENLLAVLNDRAGDEEEWLGPLDMLLAAPIPSGTDVMAWREHSRLKDLSYQWALNELEKRAATGNLPLVAAIPSS
ncbi:MULTISPECIES: cyclic nucleotide-binding and patatin-like phospholipase domain-containing protein [Rhodomicrobium]|uniref:cyclic nucleotide-binding domain-containing protein n=1 Tax=Rhodomicrobium TaxID=1068 RepID=UPI001482C3CA|nr:MULTISPECIES: cyclic nucleotide-binding and patatin-like phospholipase domain-containing protein [Rhodomicrobium]